MSPKCEVVSLSSLALYSVVVQVTYALSDDEGTHYNDVNAYYKYAPPEILEDILNEVLSNENLDAGTRFSCMQLFLKNKVRKLETGMFPHSYYERILEVINESGAALQHLNLKGIWIKDNSELLCSTLNKLNKLRVLHIPHIANDDVLKCVAKIKDLKVLNISGECVFTFDGLTCFYLELKQRNSCLNVLDIGSFGEENIPHEIIGQIITALPNMSTFSSYSYVGKALWFIYENIDSNFRCNLKYVHDTGTTDEMCRAITKTCPNLEHLYLHSAAEGSLEAIGRLTNLNNLRLTKFQCSEFLKLISQDRGKSLRNLKLSMGRGILDLSSVASNCPRLLSLELYKMELVTHESDVPFPSLNTLRLLYTKITSPCLRYVLERSPELQKVTVGEPVKLTDGDLYRLCANCCLLALEDLCFANARYLTVNAVELLMGHCPRLRLLGSLDGWNVNPNDTDFMRAVVQSTNTDLTLLPLGEYF